MADFLAYKKRLVIFAKAPELGRVKTRLAKDIGLVRATRWYRNTCRDVITPLAQDKRWSTSICVSPDEVAIGRAWSSVWPNATLRIPQGQGDLGCRMERVFKRYPPGPVLIVGSDIPGITSGHIAEAFQKLGSHDAVIGPCDDGGYWAIGFKRRRFEFGLFEGVRWSTKYAMADTVQSIQGSIAYLETLHDVDTGKDLIAR